MTTLPDRRYLSNLSRNVPVQLSSYGGAGQFSAIEWVVTTPAGLEMKSQTACMEAAIAQLRLARPQLRLGLLIRRAPWNIRGPVARHQGAWGGTGIATASIEGGESWLTTAGDAYWGFSEYTDDRILTLMEFVRKYDGIVIVIENPSLVPKIRKAAEVASNDRDITTLHVAMRLCELDRAMALWLYPSFDDREVAVYLLGISATIQGVNRAVDLAWPSLT